ncbi:MAG: glycosyl hydrolase [Ruminococcaceae bacterium]|nr:glycosyl hydrolase [Oscillospiraceae bacterium]
MDKIKEIINKMTLDEKAQLLTGFDDAHTVELPHYGIEKKTLIDGPHGVRLNVSQNCTAFPTLCCLAASWDTNLAEKMGEGLAKDCKKHNVDMLLAPGVNIKRTPLCGRNFEYFSEDPVVSGEMGAGYVKGLQENGVACSLKHFAVNNQEKYRTVISAEIDERTLREIYLKPFQTVVKKAKPESIMCAYNKVNSVWCSENPFLLTEVLRDEWGYDGFVVSDWGAVHDVARAIKAGLDLHMPPNRNIAEALKVGLEKGDITQEHIDKAVYNVLKFILKEKAVSEGYDRDKQHELAKEIATGSIVMLKNDDNMLPLTEEKYKRIAVIGEFAVNPLIAGQGSSEVHQAKEYTDNPLEELKKLLPNTEIEYREMFKRSEYSDNMLWPELYTPDFIDFIAKSDVTVVFAGSMSSEDSEMFDRRSIELNPNYERVIEAAVEHGSKVILVLQTGSAVSLERIKNTATSILEMWLGGEGAGSAIAEVLCGMANPSGKLPETFPISLRTDMEYPGNGSYVSYNEGLDVGYRYYDKHPQEICFPFGHGLSYTEFLYSDMSVSKTDDEYTVSFTLENIGDFDGAEVVQLYVADKASTMPKPIKELKQFKKIFLKKGEKQRVDFCLTSEDFANYNIMLHKWVVENGKFDILVGSSSQDIRLVSEIEYAEKMLYSTTKKGGDMVGDTTTCFG